MAERTWTVVGQDQRTGQQPDGSYGPIVRVTFRTGAGVVRSIDVPASQYTPDNVAALIDEEAARTDEISSF